MSDNTILPVFGGGSETFANDDIGSVKYPRVKVNWGADGATNDTSAANPLPVVQTGALAAGTNMVGHVGGAEYETVAASQSDQSLGATGGSGDYLAGVLIVPATTSPDAVSIKDGSGSAITIFTGGASSVSNLVPFYVAIGAKSTGGAWKVTTGANVSAIGFGDFT